jgi:hypothetical protein
LDLECVINSSPSSHSTLLTASYHAHSLESAADRG